MAPFLVLWCLNKLLTVAKIQNQSFTFFQDFCPWKGTFECRNPKWFDQKISEQSCLDASPDRPHSKFFCFILFSLVPEKTHVDPKTNCFWDELGSLSLRGIFLMLKLTATKPWKFDDMFSLGVQKKNDFKIFSRAVPEVRSKKVFSWIKSRKIAQDFFDFRKSKVSSVIKITIENIKTTVIAPCERPIPDQLHHSPFKAIEILILLVKCHNPSENREWKRETENMRELTKPTKKTANQPINCSYER